MEKTVAHIWPALLDGLTTTMTISLAALLLGAPLALLLASAGRGGRWIRALAGIYLSFWRGTPILVQLLIIFYILPFLGLELDPVVAATVALALNTAAFQSEIYRAGLQAIPKGEIEAAKMLGLSPRTIFLHIEVPQAFRTMLPALVGEMQALVKNSSLVSVIAVTDLTRRAQQVAASTFRPLDAYAFALILYVAIGILLAGVGLLIERRLSHGSEGQ
ncbi:amino acid ABC transporter permease [Rhizobium hidalgonense]|uniref:Amino acid ABC transporter n=1 Tax=Rhizobium hidalgonense TaxID=1538159 RepID=A0A2A6K923_9HYPH|nr:amino acid ABC transporter permease [Rhizobium hidalgonense]MDR9776951.1 amino acid ABC transporter permease [Rhizobium hidalgonense]MDR9813997.1 amino acid ABC transporter permease [Rhizobium hidalgonense]MDR9820685.1 amino acid ABC transporter permease [Rhizobium hidalgonense]PDT21377.1 amino acid ABC transporter [Rhizobium hidalgonense]PON08036.1 amino acid ABC transporter [Rhizobium hidalgonense]